MGDQLNLGSVKMVLGPGHVMATPPSPYSTMNFLQASPSVSPAAPTGLIRDEVMASLPTLLWGHYLVKG